ncbi:hypothetical protein GCM10009615_07790 [Corynebacterium durum]
MPSYWSRVGVPALISTADAIAAKSADSEGVSHIAGEAPTARRTLAVISMTTLFVKHCTKGFISRTADTAQQS